MLKPHVLSQESYGLLLMVFSAILYSVAGVFVKLCSSGGLPSTEIVFLRGLVQGGLVVFSMINTVDPNSTTGKTLIYEPFGPPGLPRAVVIGRGFIGGAGLVFDYHCMTVLPLGDAISLMSLYPIITILLARVFLGEEITPLHVCVTLASIVGATLIAQPTFLFASHQMTTSSTIGYISGILGSCCLSCVVTLIRKAGSIGVHALQLLISWASFGLFYSLILGFVLGSDWIVPPSTKIWFYIAGVCSIGAAAHFLLNFAGRIAPAGLVSVVRSSDIMWAYLWEIWIFHETPNKWTWLGVLLVLGSLTAIAIQKVSEQRGALAKSHSNASTAVDDDSDESRKLLVDEEDEHADVEMQEKNVGVHVRSRTRKGAATTMNGGTH